MRILTPEEKEWDILPGKVNTAASGGEQGWRRNIIYRQRRCRAAHQGGILPHLEVSEWSLWGTSLHLFSWTLQNGFPKLRVQHKQNFQELSPNKTTTTIQIYYHLLSSHFCWYLNLSGFKWKLTWRHEVICMAHSWESQTLPGRICQWQGGILKNCSLCCSDTYPYPWNKCISTYHFNI